MDVENDAEGWTGDEAWLLRLWSVWRRSAGRTAWSYLSYWPGEACVLVIEERERKRRRSEGHEDGRDGNMAVWVRMGAWSSVVLGGIGNGT